MTRTHSVTDADAHARAVAEYRQDGYHVVSEGDGETTLRHASYGSLLAHLALFFTVGWLTLGVLNVVYAIHKRKETADTVRVVTQ